MAVFKTASFNRWATHPSPRVSAVEGYLTWIPE